MCKLTAQNAFRRLHCIQSAHRARKPFLAARPNTPCGRIVVIPYRSTRCERQPSRIRCITEFFRVRRLRVQQRRREISSALQAFVRTKKDTVRLMFTEGQEIRRRGTHAKPTMAARPGVPWCFVSALQTFAFPDPDNDTVRFEFQYSPIFKPIRA